MRSDLTVGILNSDPNLPPEDFVRNCYRRILGREGDASGVAYYTAQAAKSRNRLSVAAEIAASDEAMSLPRYTKYTAAEVLAAHAHDLILSALTRSQKRRAIARVQRYFWVLLGVDARRSADSKDDPFARYLHEVIEGPDFA